MISRIPIKLPEKSPYKGWKLYQSERMSEEELAFQKKQYNTEAEAEICGSVSGNLEVVDIDEKHQPGISAAYLTALKSLIPDVFPTLGIVRTPSGGHHIKYHCPAATIPGNKKLAYAEGAKEACIETRGEGGYVVAPPSPGYVVIQPGAGVVSREVRDMILGVAESFNKRVKIQKIKTSKAQDRKYSINPFDDYNNSPEAESILEGSGWTVCGDNANYTYYTRPGKDKGISASFVKDKRIYYIFTSSTELEPSKGYTPAGVVAKLYFNDDWKELRRDLVSKGYGKLRPEVEEQVIKNAVETGIELPVGISDEGREVAARMKQERVGKYPHGVFWKPKQDSDEYKINRQNFLDVCRGLGLRTYRDVIYRIEGYRMCRMEVIEFIDFVKSYIKEDIQAIYDEVANAYEAFMKENTKYIITRLDRIGEGEIEKDTKDICRKFYRNGFVEITKDGFILIPYEKYTGGLIRSERFLDRDYVFHTGASKYRTYLELATNYVFDPAPIQKCIGFLAHEWKDETTGYIVVLTEECPDPKQGGGTGKNIFCKLLSNVTTYVNKNGRQSKYDETFFQVWSGQRIMSISDVPKNFPYEFLNEPATGSILLKKLWKDETEIPVSDTPKFIIQTNFGVEISDGGVGRRVIQIEFTNFFTKAGGVDKYFGGAHFPNDWTREDWGGFDTIICESIMTWMAGNCKLSPIALSGGGQVKQFEQTHGKIATQMMEECFSLILSEANLAHKVGVVSMDKLREIISGFYNENDIAMAHRISKKRIKDALADWTKMQGYQFDRDVVFSDFGMSKRGVKIWK